MLLSFREQIVFAVIPGVPFIKRTPPQAIYVIPRWGKEAWPDLSEPGTVVTGFLILRDIYRTFPAKWL